MGLSNINQRGFSPNKGFGWLNLTHQYLRSLVTSGVGLPAYGIQLAYDNFFRALSPRGDVSATIYPRNLAAYYPNDPTALRLDGSNNVILWEDKSGNSATNGLSLNGVNANYASFAALTAFGTGDLTLVADVRPTSFGASRGMVGGAAGSIGFFINSAGFAQTSLDGTANNTASTTQLVVLTRYTLTYVRSGTIGTYYVNGVVAGTTADSRTYSVGQSQIGALGGATLVFDGIIYAARVYSAALDATAVLNDYNGIVQANIVHNSNIALVAKLAASYTPITGTTVTINTTGDTGARICGERDLYQGTAANRPAYTAASGGNRLFLTFDGTNDYLKSTAFALSQPTSVYFVGQQVTWVSGRDIYDGGSANVMVLQQTSGGASPNLFIYAGANGPATNNLSIATTGIIAAIFNGASSLLRINRTGVVTGNASTTSANGFTLGAGGGASVWANIRVQEIAIYSEASSPTTMAGIINYFSSKYSISL